MAKADKLTVAAPPKVTEVKFTRRFTTETSYEFEEITLTSVITEGDDAAEVLAKMKADAEAAHAGGVLSSKQAEKSADDEDVEGNEEEETEDDAEEIDDGEETDDAEEEEEEEEEAEEPPKKPKASKTAPGSGSKKKNFKPKPQIYQRSNSTHMNIFSTMLKTAFPDWKKSTESKAHAKKISQNMEGEEFLDDNGKVLDSFYNAVKKAVKAKK